jgi:hypothetical protein
MFASCIKSVYLWTQILVIKRRSREAEILGRRLQAYTHICKQAPLLKACSKPIKEWKNVKILFRFSEDLLLAPSPRVLGSNFAQS